ncbi:HNH endonuclease [Pseudomonas capsici]|uniref:HNH endonuclease n=1 Tax=Pseudomonas capsici TaxID=2810614 RepID=UPI0021F21A04|nr:HNH endonuclease [Pseudomonas capsici]MCV4287918.1 HNH endonuclease [Pseudomonas capsici]
MARGVNKVILVGRGKLASQIVDLYVYGFSITEIESLIGLHRSTVRHHVSRAGVLRTRSEGVQAAASEGRLGSGLRGTNRVFTEEHKRNIRKARLEHGKTHARGISLKPSGYVEITRGENKGRSLHRALAEQMLGRKLGPKEHVHHRDGNKSNNDPDNLEVMSGADHCSMHAKELAKHRERNPDGTWR